MKTGRQFLLWFIVAVLFCAVTLGGCGGGHDGDPVGTQEESTTTDNGGSGGREVSGFDDMAFESLSGQWTANVVMTTMHNHSRGRQFHCNGTTFSSSAKFRIKAYGDSMILVWADYDAGENPTQLEMTPITVQFYNPVNPSEKGTFNVLLPAEYTPTNDYRGTAYKATGYDGDTYYIVFDDEISYNPDSIGLIHKHKDNNNTVFSDYTIEFILRNDSHDY